MSQNLPNSINRAVLIGVQSSSLIAADIGYTLGAVLHLKNKIRLRRCANEEAKLPYLHSMRYIIGPPTVLPACKSKFDLWRL